MDMKKIVIGLGIGLFLSLAANLFMAGMVMGRAVGNGEDAASHISPKADSALAERDRQLRQKLSSEDQSALKTVMGESRVKFQQLRQDLQAAQQAVEDATYATPFDQPALDEALRVEKNIKQALLSEMQKTRESALARLSPEGQRAFREIGGRRKWQEGGQGGERLKRLQDLRERFGNSHSQEQNGDSGGRFQRRIRQHQPENAPYPETP